MKRNSLNVSLIVCTGVLARFIMTNIVVPELSPGGDAPYYLGIADNLRMYGVYGYGEVKDFYRAPLYPVFLFLVTFLGKRVVVNAYIVQSAISIITSLYVYYTFRYRSNHLQLGSWFPRAMALITVASPFAIVQ